MPFLSGLWAFITYPGAIFMRLFFAFVFGVPLFAMAWAIIKPLIDCYLSLRWRIDRYNFIAEYTLFTWRWRRSELRSAIIKVTYHPTFYQDTGDGRYQVPPKLILQVGVREYILISLTKAELEWLAFEINNWLDSSINSFSA